MLDKTRWYIRRAVFRTYRYLKHPRRLKVSPVMRWFARHFLDKRVWRPCQPTFAGGCAIGFFVCAQLIPGQMPLGILLAAIFRVNIPTVIIISWISNPVTFAPIGLAEKHFGDWLIGILGDPLNAIIHRIENPDVEKGVRFAQSMYLGGIISGLLATPIGYALGWMSWTGVARLLRIPLAKRLHFKREHRVEAAPPAAGDNDPPVI